MGPLIDSKGAGIRSLKSVLRHKFGVTDDLAGIEIAGRTDTGIVHQILRKQNIPVTEENTAGFLEIISNFSPANCHNVKVGCLPGRGRIIVPTGGPSAKCPRPPDRQSATRRAAQTCALRHLGFFRVWRVCRRSSRSQPSGPFAQERARAAHSIDFAAANIDVIGDTPHDIGCGKAIGARTIAVATGSFSREQLSAASAGFRLSRFLRRRKGHGQARLVASLRLEGRAPSRPNLVIPFKQTDPRGSP